MDRGPTMRARNLTRRVHRKRQPSSFHSVPKIKTELHCLNTFPFSFARILRNSPKKFPTDRDLRGLLPSASACYHCSTLVSVAQLVEHRSVAPRVAGSNPVAHPNHSPLSMGFFQCRRDFSERVVAKLVAKVLSGAVLAAKDLCCRDFNFASRVRCSFAIACCRMLSSTLICVGDQVGAVGVGVPESVRHWRQHVIFWKCIAVS